MFVDVSLQVDEKDRGQTALIRAAKFGMVDIYVNYLLIFVF